jgi:hypothetical protein
MPRHRHRFQTELSVVLEGRGRLRVEGTLLELAPLSAGLVDPDSLRQVFNDTDAAATWLIVGAPPEQITISDELYAAEHRRLYPGATTRAAEADVWGRPMCGWLGVIAEDLDVPGALEHWVQIGVAYARTLAAKS